MALNLHIATTDEIAQLVANGILDFAINGGNLNYHSHIAALKLYEDDLLLACSAERYQSLGTSHITPDQLNGIHFIAHQPNSQLSKVVSDFIAELQISSQIVMTLGNIDAIKQAVAANLGVSLVPRTAVTLELKTGLLKELTLEHKRLTYPYHLIYHKNKFLSPATLKLMEKVCHAMCSDFDPRKLY